MDAADKNYGKEDWRKSKSSFYLIYLQPGVFNESSLPRNPTEELAGKVPTL